MAKWINLPSAYPLQFNPYQDAFWKAHRGRICRDCRIEFDCVPPSFACPNCQGKGIRKYHRLALLSGRRGGKTRAAAIATTEAAAIPNSVIWCCAPTNPKLHRYVIPAMQELIPQDWIKKDASGWSAEFLDLRLKNGTLVHFQTLDDPDQGRGQGLDLVWMDEACELTLEHWEVLRPSLTERRGAAIISSSPKGYDWVWSKFYKQAEMGTPGYWACKYATKDNPIITAEEVADAKATMSAEMFQQEYEADFVIFEGAVFGGYLDLQILRSQEQIRSIIPEWPNLNSDRQVLVGIDTGADHPFGAVKIVSTEKGLVVVGEYLERNRSFIEHAQEIKRLASSPTTHWAINKNDKQATIELAQHGIMCRAAQNDVVAGIERVKSWLLTKKLWFIEPTCRRTIDQLKSYRWAKNEANDGQVRKEKVFKMEDELPDALRYALMSWPLLPTPVEDEAPKRDISKLDPEMRGMIERMRRIDAKENEYPSKVLERMSSIAGDFWGNELSDSE